MDFGHELLPSDLERISDLLDLAFERIPTLGQGAPKPN